MRRTKKRGAQNLSQPKSGLKIGSTYIITLLKYYAQSKAFCKKKERESIQACNFDTLKALCRIVPL